MQVYYEEYASETIVLAAEELTKYLKRMIQEPLEDGWNICLLSNAKRFPKGANDSYQVRIEAGGGKIIGNNDRSVLLGVYDYLHYLGCRFPVPQKEYERIPCIGKEKLAASYEKQASFFHRGICIEGADSFENIMDYITWLPKVGFNSFFFQFKTPYAFLARWYRHLENPYAEEEPYTQEDVRRDMDLLELAAKKRGLLLHKAGHGWTGEVLGYPTVSWDVQTGEVSETYRHRIAMLDGKREFYKGIPANTNLCYHNADAIDAFAELVTTYAREHPQVDYLHVWLADEYNNLCECEDCRKVTLADQYVTLLNEIDRRLAAEQLDTRIVFLLYQELLWPPKVCRLEHPERFVLMFAPISRTFEKSYELCEGAKELPPFVRNHITLPTNLTENVSFLKGWQAVFGGDGFVYDYPLGRAHYGDFGYVHIARVIHSDIQKLQQMGLNGYISCQELRAAFPNALPDYVMAYTLFEKNISVDDVIEEYMSACYGGASGQVSEYLSKLSALGSSDYVNGKGERCDASMALRMEKVSACCEEFKAEIRSHQNEDGSWESIYWEILEYHRNYIMLFSDALHSLAMGEAKEADKKWETMREYICKNEQKYQPFLDVYRVLEVTKKYTGFYK